MPIRSADDFEEIRKAACRILREREAAKAETAAVCSCGYEFGHRITNPDCALHQHELRGSSDGECGG